jgi:hypothetical protein
MLNMSYYEEARWCGCNTYELPKSILKNAEKWLSVNTVCSVYHISYFAVPCWRQWPYPVQYQIEVAFRHNMLIPSVRSLLHEGLNVHGRANWFSLLFILTAKWILFWTNCNTRPQGFGNINKTGVLNFIWYTHFNSGHKNLSRLTF